MLARGEELAELPGIGRVLAAKIAELVATGHLAALDALEHEVPAGLAELMRLPGLGPKRVAQLHDVLGIDGVDALAKALAGGRLDGVPGIGARTRARLREALARERGAPRRWSWLDAEAVARALVAHLEGVPGVDRVEVAGSFRRRRETVGDLDLLVACARGAPVVERFVAHEDVERVAARGSKRATVVLRSGLQVDLRVVAPESFGAALHYFTGSKAHNVAVRRLAVREGLKLNEYGVFRGARRIGGRSEEEVFASVGLPYVEPELREDRGELEAARRGRLPRLVAEGDLRGDLHVHTKASDGRASAEAMALAARERGHEYLAIADHTAAARVARGLDARRMRRHLESLAALGARLRGIRLLRAAEVDILEDGSLDLPDEVLGDLELVIGAVHSHFALPRERQTERILRAMDHPRFHVLAHPTGRLLGSREGYAVDMERLIEGAAARGCCLELNAQPERLDLSDLDCRAAKEAGVKLALSSDAHSVEQLDFLRLGIGQARRGWLEPDDLLNTRRWSEIETLLAGRR